MAQVRTGHRRSRDRALMSAVRTKARRSGAWERPAAARPSEGATTLDRSRNPFIYGSRRESSPAGHRTRTAASAAGTAADPGDQSAVELARAHAGPVRRPRPGRLGTVGARPR